MATIENCFNSLRQKQEKLHCGCSYIQKNIFSLKFHCIILLAITLPMDAFYRVHSFVNFILKIFVADEVLLKFLLSMLSIFSSSLSYKYLRCPLYSFIVCAFFLLVGLHYFFTSHKWFTLASALNIEKLINPRKTGSAFSLSYLNEVINKHPKYNRLKQNKKKAKTKTKCSDHFVLCVTTPLNEYLISSYDLTIKFCISNGCWCW